MDPRLKTSTKWTAYPEELLQQIQDVVHGFFEDYDLGNGRFVINGAIYPEEILLRIGVNEPGRLQQDNFEASLEYDSKNEKALDLIHVMADFLGETWIQFLEDEPEPESLPRPWQENNFQGKKIFLRYTTVNTELERQADELLNESDKRLVYGDDQLPDDAEGDRA